MAIRNIRELGEPCLRKICKPVKEVNLRTKILIGDMFDTMYEANGVGLAAPQVPKRFFGAARNMREGGSLTILATALVETGSKMDDVVYEEFKGTGNMELVLDRKLSEKRIFPAIDITKSGTRREDLLLDSDEMGAAYIIRKEINGLRKDDAVEQVLNLFARTKDNKEFISKIARIRSAHSR